MLCFSNQSLAIDRDGLRGERYCEVVFSKGRLFKVYNTINLNTCPDRLWQKVTVQSVKKQTGAYHVYLNGPRNFLVDGVKNSQFKDPNPVVFHGLAMRNVGVLHLTFRDLIFGAAPYREHHVERETIWVYKAGKRIYELISPKGVVYVMQSYAISPEQESEQDLLALNTRLTLPKGWQYKTGILNQETDLKTIRGEAGVLQDNAHNTYQKATHDFL